MNIKSKSAQAVVEYILLLSLISVICISTLHGIGLAVKEVLQIVMLELNK